MSSQGSSAGGGEAKVHQKLVEEGQACFEWEDETGETVCPLPACADALTELRAQLDPFLKTQPKKGPHAETLAKLD